MVLSTAHGASTLFAAEWNDMIYALNHADSTVDHQAMSSNTNWNATTSAHGYLPSLDTFSTKFLTSTGGWAAPTTANTNLISTGNLPTEMWKAYTTGTATTMFAELSTFVGALATVTSWAYPIYSVRIPNYVLPSKVDVTVTAATCSTNVVNTSVLLFVQAAPRAGSNQPVDFKTTATLSTKMPGVIFGIFPSCSSWAVFSTIMTIAGGETYTFYALSTTAPLVKIKDFKFIGTTAVPQYPADVWTTAYGSTVG
jgi:hypothetical protein